jgi:RHS repeat-associated protein
VVWVEAWQVPVRAFSAFGNDHFLHGRPYVASVRLYDHRARFYEARTGTFLEPDPLGPVDSPNLYQAFAFDALSVTDPFGQCQWKDLECWNWVAKDFVLTTERDIAVGLVDAATLGIPRRMVREYRQGNVQTFADIFRVAADAITNTVTLGARDLYEGGASTWEVVKAVLGISAIQQGAALVGEGLGSGDTELALRGVGEFSGGVGIFAGWAAGSTKGVQTATKGARTLVRTGDDLARAAAYGMQEWALETEGLANGTARLAVIGRTPALNELEQRLGKLEGRLRMPDRPIDWRSPANRDLFWRKYNRPWLMDKINRGEPIVVVSDPYELTNIYFQGQPDLGPTFFGREVQLLKEYGYRFRRLPGGGWLATPGK